MRDRAARPLGRRRHVEHLVLQVREEEEQRVGLGRYVARAAVGQVQPQLAAVGLTPSAVEVVDGRENAPREVLRVGVPAVEAAALVACELHILVRRQRP